MPERQQLGERGNEMMKLTIRLLNSIKTYPHRARFPNAIMLLCVLALLVHTSGPLTDSTRVVVGGLALAVFFQHRGRPFWFFGGIAIGAGLVDALSRLHSLFGH